MAEKKTTTKRVAKKTVEKEVVDTVKVRPFRELRKILTKDTEVLIMNNSQGHFYYSCPKTNISVDMTDFGDTQIVPLELLETMKRRAKKIFANYIVMIIDVFPETEEEVAVNDVLRYLDIASMYDVISEVANENENDGTYGEDFFDTLIIDKGRDDFERLAKKMNKKLLIQFAHRCVELYKSGEFDSRYKMDIIQSLLGAEDLFSDIDLTL